ITNILGQIIYREENVNLQNKTFNLGYVENGTYTLTVKADGKTAKEKLIINK
ncbi:MAG: T9SS type A sorting domain-containing protein, partial [Bacteroidales bacterium]|nr:T9SS type A sorting domain-containing protein [Bacteroidales bacterium]